MQEDEAEEVEGEGLNRIQIAVRVRPVLPHEASQPVAVTCSTDGSSVQIMLPEREFSKPALAASSKPDAKAYEFDACLPGSTTQAELFDVCGLSDLVESAVDGYNVTVFAFGQTGSGKTYSIIGPNMAGMQGFDDSCAVPAQHGCDTPSAELDSGGPSTPKEPGSSGLADGHPMQQPQGAGSRCSSRLSGVQPQQQQLSEHEGLLARCVHQLYASIAQRRDTSQCSVTISCTEVYNEQVTDMLCKNKNQQLHVRKDPRTEAFYVDGLTHAPAQTAGRALRVLSEAMSYRHTRAHKLNSYSSRSHCLITMTISSQDNSCSSPGQELMQGVKAGGMRRQGKLVLVDLAGSERLNSTGNTGARDSVKETGAINKSLFILGQVLAALSVRGGIGGNSHVPYRDSRLTQLLWEGLRGGGRVLMLACLCPLKFAAEESINTLHFASMALRIKSVPVMMIDPQDAQLNDMRTMIKVLQEDCKSLASALTQICNTGADVGSVLQTLPPNLVQDALRYGSSSAPALDQQLRQRQGSPNKSTRGSRGGLRGSGSLGKPKAIFMSKPASADPTMRHSMPALPYHSNSGPSSPTKSPNSKQRASHQQQQRQLPLGTGSRGELLPVLGFHTSGRSSPSWGAAGSSSSPAWQVYGSPPRSSNSTPARSKAGRGPGPGGSASKLDGAGALSMGPSTGAKLYPGSLRQDLYHAGASGLNGVLSGPSSGMGGSKQSWAFSSRFDGPPPCTSQLVEVRNSSPGRGRGVPAGAEGTSNMFGYTYQAGVAGIGKRPQQEAQAPSLDSFPELAALEQRFQQRQEQEQLLQQPFDVQLLGHSGVLLPSGLPASISDPRSLVPVRIGVSDGECLGTSPDASPVAVALAAAGSPVRPIAVPLPAELTAAAAAAAAGGGGEGAGASGEGGGGEGVLPAKPDPQALTWAERNVWFGADEEMTRLAYKVHDMLVGEQGVDPTSPLYYTAIESHVAAAFPDKWAHWQQVMALGARGRGSSTQLPAQQSSYVSYKLPLKSPVPRFKSPGRSPPQQQPSQQQVQDKRGGGAPIGSTLPLSQLLQHPALGEALSPRQQQHQQLLLDKSLPQQLLQQYQQEHPQLMMQQLQQQQQQLPQQSSRQQQTRTSWSLPELRQSESPQPPDPPGGDAGRQQGQQQQQGSSPSAGQGMLAGGSSLGFSGVGIAAHHPQQQQQQYKHRYNQQPSAQLQQQQQCEAGSLTASRSSLGGISTAASKVLQASHPSFYDGAGPLTTGMKPKWTSSNQRGVQAGQDLAQVLRSGLNPGNKSLAEMQVEYRAARAQVLDRLRQQKEAAEVQRKQILLQLGRAISNSAWRA